MTNSTGLAYRPNTSPSPGAGNRSGQAKTQGRNPSSGRAKADGPAALRASFDPQGSSPFRRTAQMLTNHFEVQNGNIRQLFEYPLTIARLHPAPPANQAAGLRMPLRVRRRLIYLLVQQLTIGDHAAPATGTQPPAAPGTQPPTAPGTRSSTAPGTQPTVSDTRPAGPSTQSAAPQSRSSSQHPAQAAHQLSPDALQSQSGAKQVPVTSTPPQSTGAPAQGGHVPQPRVLSPIRVASNYNNALFTVQRIPRQRGVGIPHL